MPENVEFGNDAFSVALVPNTLNANTDTALVGSPPGGVTISPDDVFVITVENLSPQVSGYVKSFCLVLILSNYKSDKNLCLADL